MPFVTVDEHVLPLQVSGVDETSYFRAKLYYVYFLCVRNVDAQPRGGREVSLLTERHTRHHQDPFVCPSLFLIDPWSLLPWNTLTSTCGAAW